MHIFWLLIFWARVILSYRYSDLFTDILTTDIANYVGIFWAKVILSNVYSELVIFLAWAIEVTSSSLASGRIFPRTVLLKLAKYLEPNELKCYRYYLDIFIWFSIFISFYTHRLIICTSFIRAGRALFGPSHLRFRALRQNRTGRNRTGITGQVEQDKQNRKGSNRTGRTRQADRTGKQDRHVSSKTGQAERDRQNRTGRTAQAERDIQNGSFRMGQVKQDT